MLTPRPLGVCSWTFGDRPLAEIAGRLHALGYDGMELAGDLGRYSAAEAAAIAGDHGLSIFSLTPANVDLAHPDGSVRQAAEDYYRQLVAFAAVLGEPLVSCHGYVGRVRPVATMSEERGLLVDGVRRIGQAGAERGLRIVFEVLNRYESHLVHTAEAALALVAEVGLPNVGILLDAYHMNIEETEPAGAIRAAGEKLWLYHAADSNRRGIGRGHTGFDEQVAALDDIGYGGPIIMECTAPGPDPFRAIKDERSLAWLEDDLRESRQWLRRREG
jgi:sugar phosphate isomerase/epimerase